MVIRRNECRVNNRKIDRDYLQSLRLELIVV